MNKMVLVLVAVTVTFAQPQQSEHFTLAKSVIDAGGGSSSSATFNLVSAFGQPTPIGVQSSANFTLSAGFLSPLLTVSPLSPIQHLVIKEAQPDAVLNQESITGAGSCSIYRAAAINFAMGPSNLIGTTAGTAFTDTNVLAGPAIQQYCFPSAH
jgi:hypothetical protein